MPCVNVISPLSRTACPGKYREISHASVYERCTVNSDAGAEGEGEERNGAYVVTPEAVCDPWAGTAKAVVGDDAFRGRAAASTRWQLSAPASATSLARGTRTRSSASSPTHGQRPSWPINCGTVSCKQPSLPISRLAHGAALSHSSARIPDNSEDLSLPLLQTALQRAADGDHESFDVRRLWHALDVGGCCGVIGEGGLLWANSRASHSGGDPNAEIKLVKVITREPTMVCRIDTAALAPRHAPASVGGS